MQQTLKHYHIDARTTGTLSTNIRTFLIWTSEDGTEAKNIPYSKLFWRKFVETDSVGLLTQEDEGVTGIISKHGAIKPKFYLKHADYVKHVLNKIKRF